MNFLQLVQRLHVEAGCSGNAPVTVIGQVGESARLVNWINSAWVDIQSSHQDWQFLRKTATFQTVQAQATYTPAGDILLTDFGRWDIRTFRNYQTSVGMQSEIYMDAENYDAWRDMYQYGALRYTYTRPIKIAIGPNKELCLGPVPVAGYTVIGDYYTVPVSLALDTDTPAIPTSYHMAIVYRALIWYGLYESAPEAISRGTDEFSKMMQRLDIDWLKPLESAGSLA